MKKKIKSAVISIVVIAVLLLAILIGVKNGTLDKLTKEMPTLETKQPRKRQMKKSRLSEKIEMKFAKKLRLQQMKTRHTLVRQSRILKPKSS